MRGFSNYRSGIIVSPVATLGIGGRVTLLNAVTSPYSNPSTKVEHFLRAEIGFTDCQ